MYIKKLLFSILVFGCISVQAVEKIELGSDYLLENGMYNYETYVKYSTTTKKDKDVYGVQLGQRYFFYDKKQLDKDYYLQLEQVYHVKGKDYWENYFYISKDQTFLPQYQIELNRYWVYKEEELSAGVRYTEYKRTTIVTPILQAIVYFNRGDSIALKGFFTYYRGFRPYYMINYNKYITDNWTIKPYFFFGQTIEDVGLYDRFKTIGLETTYKWNATVKTKVFGEEYSGEKYRRDETKVGFAIEFSF